MSTEIKSDLKRYALNQSWGGDENGMSISVHCIDDSKFRDPSSSPLQQEGYIRLDMTEALQLATALVDFVTSTAKRRQGYLKDHISDLKGFEKTIFKEVAELEFDAVNLKKAEFILSLVEKFCPKAPKRLEES